ncbi:metal-dependent hydrolase [Luteimonas aquatica]|uniref:metal-dependent hydrolase n=1 Tax=Luteimonas aquatica TaxID=450364 RepID=UPI001F5A36D5|nr:metal-dependent hydrolase [Luteimonas aquatica]
MNTAVAHAEAIVPRENLDFGLGNDLPRYWFKGNPYKTRYLDALQMGFPDGERYFITSVRAFRDGITDPAMQEDVRNFMRQEGQHGMTHTRYNRMLQAQGLPVDNVVREMKRILDADTERFSPEFNLAATAGFEHFTAMLAEAFFARASVTAGSDPHVVAMFAWHAIEEMEHKSVAYDVMQKVAKVGYWKRAGAMLFATWRMASRSYVTTDVLLRADGYGFWSRLGLHLRYFPWVYGPRRGIFGSLAPKLLAYFKPGFHPQQLPNIHNYPAWVEAYERTGDPLIASEALLAAAHR